MRAAGLRLVVTRIAEKQRQRLRTLRLVIHQRPLRARLSRAHHKFQRQFRDWPVLASRTSEWLTGVPQRVADILDVSVDMFSGSSD